VKVAAEQVIDGKYAIERELGSGAMGIVVAARSVRPGGRVPVGTRVAVKVMLPELAKNAELVERFKREAVAALKLRSQHVTRLLDIGQLPDGPPYMVMEYLQGASLTQILAQGGPLPLPRAVSFVLQACDALAEAHAMGIVHRDLKVENLFVEQDGERPQRIKVLDFGLAKLTAPGNLKLTASRVTMGSPQYMSPEQLRSSAAVDPATDVWSLGVCFYEMLTCSMPFDASSMPMLFTKILEEKAVPIRDRRADLPLEIEAIIERCLEKDPARRWASIDELAKALRPYARTEAAPTIPQARWREMQRKSERPRALFLAALTVGAVVIAAAVFALTYYLARR
jgi:serine/threonine-protein kinase